jgi:hypothetical protein
MAARLTLVALCAGLIALAAWQAKPLHRWVQAWRAERMCRQAEVLLDERQVMAALQMAQEAARMAPDSAVAARLNAEILSKGGRPEALYFFDRLGQLGQLRDQDKVLKVRALVGMQRRDEAGRLLEGLLNEMPATSEMMELASFIWPNEPSKLVGLMRRFAQSHPADREHALRLARAEITTGDAAALNQGLARAWQLHELANDALGLRALELLDGSTDLSAGDSLRLIEALRAHPLAEDRHLASAYRREYQSQPLRAQEILARAVSEIRIRGLVKSAAILHWLLEPPQNQYQLVLNLIDPEAAWEQPRLLECRLTALTALERFKELEALVLDARVQKLLSVATRGFYRAHLAFVMRKPQAETAAALDLAVKQAEAENRADLMQRLAGYAEVRGHYAIARQAFEILARLPQLQKPAYDGLLRVLLQAGEVDELLEIGRKVISLYPQESQYHQLLIYVGMLAGRDMELGCHEAKRWGAKLPGEAQWAFLEALACWRLGDAQRARELLQSREASLLTRSEGQRIVLAWVARQCGLKSLHDQVNPIQRPLADGVSLMPQEREILQWLHNPAGEG